MTLKINIKKVIKIMSHYKSYIEILHATWHPVVSPLMNSILEFQGFDLDF